MDFKLAVFVCLALGYAYVISQKLDAHSNVCFRDRFQCECNQTNTTVEIMRQQHVQIIDITNRLQTSEKKIQELEGRYRQILLRLERLPGDNIEQPTDCQALQMLNMNNSLPDGVYTISPSRGNEVLAYCDMSDGGWTVFQRRFSGEENFYRNWKDYREGFGDPAKEYWLGNEFLHELTRDRICSLKIEMVNWDDLARYAEYTDFNIDNETEGFRLHIGEYSGDASDSLALHNGMEFTTKDVDNDRNLVDNCAMLFTGAWWYDSCHHSNLNGDYSQRDGKGIKWWQYPSSDHMKATIMKLKCY